MKIGFVFAGQGQQFLGMGNDLAEEYNWAHDIFREASAILGYDLLKLINEDASKLNQTAYTQPALFTVNYILQNYLEKNGVNPEMVAGLSLGEYNALVCAGVLSFSDALKIIKVRAFLMDNAFAKGETKMAAVLKADADKINEILEDDILENDIKICNYNTFEQVVIGGSSEKLEIAIPMLNEQGFKRVIPLDVSCVSHHPLLNKQADELAIELAKYDFKKPRIDFIGNVSGQLQIDGFDKSLANHIIKPTYLAKSIALMLDSDVDVFIEIGPKKTISSFIKSIAKSMDKEVQIFNVYDLNTLNESVVALNE